MLINLYFGYFGKKFFLLAPPLFLIENAQMRYLFSIILTMMLFCRPAAATPVKDEAERLYQAYGDAIYQIQVIDLTSGKKTSIGSGFQFTAEGWIATNYHVVAEAIQHPDSNRVEFLRDKGERGGMTVLMADVVHDIAIIKMDTPGKSFLTLGSSHLLKGTKIFSLGNPHDLGFTIIEGTYNGLSKESFVDKIHFSGSLNPGMSGGPAISHDGKVVGINVATAGNQISFLVPIEPLRKLAADYARKPASYNFLHHADDYIQEQLLQKRDADINLLLKKKWESVPFGPVMVPGRTHEALKCWGGIDHREKDPYNYFFSMCASQDNIFLDDDFGTGNILYRYNYIVGKKSLNLERFYSFYQKQFSTPSADYNNAKESNVTNFRCNSSFIDIAGRRWKSNFCTRQYKRYPDIFDMNLYMAMVGEGKKGLTVSVSTQGVSKKNALLFAKRFISEIKTPPKKERVPAKKKGAS